MQQDHNSVNKVINSKIWLIIPCRLNSTRLPNKVLLPINNLPMVVKVYQQVQAIPVYRCFVLCEDSKIKLVCDEFSVPAEHCNQKCVNGTHRIASWLMKRDIADDDIIINVQADEPYLDPRAVTQVINILVANTKAAVATLWSPIDRIYAADPNRVKLITAVNNRVIYFSRSLIPNGDRSQSQQQIYKMHLGLYGYRAWALKHYYDNQVSDLSQQESLEQLSFIDQDIPIYAEQAKVRMHPGIDTLYDYQRAIGAPTTGEVVI